MHTKPIHQSDQRKYGHRPKEIRDASVSYQILCRSKSTMTVADRESGGGGDGGGGRDRGEKRIKIGPCYRYYCKTHCKSNRRRLLLVAVRSRISSTSARVPLSKNICRRACTVDLSPHKTVRYSHFRSQPISFDLHHYVLHCYSTFQDKKVRERKAGERHTKRETDGDRKTSRDRKTGRDIECGIN